MKYEVSRSNTFRVIALQRKCGQTDRRTDGQTDGQTDKVITIGLPHLRWRGPKYAKSNDKERLFIYLAIDPKGQSDLQRHIIFHMTP